MKKIIAIKEGQHIPDNAVFIKSETKKEKVGESIDSGFFFITRYEHFKQYNIFYYEVQDEK